MKLSLSVETIYLGAWKCLAVVGVAALICMNNLLTAC